MTVRTSTNLPVTLGWISGQDGWGGDMNRNLGLLATLTQLTIESLSFGTPPGGVSEWDVYHVADNPTGPWVGQQGRLAVRLGDAWEFVTPNYGWLARLRSTGAAIWWNGDQWVDNATGDPADGGSPVLGPVAQKVFYSRPGTPGPGERMLVPIDQPLILPVGASNSRAVCESAPQTSAQYRILRNGGQVGTITFSAGSYTGVFSIPSSVTFGLGDILTLVAPPVEVNDFADVAIVLRLTFTGS